MTRKDEIRAACERRAEEAMEVVGSASWYAQGKAVLTPDELAEVSRLWEAMPGHTCWTHAFLRWMEQEGGAA